MGLFVLRTAAKRHSRTSDEFFQSAAAAPNVMAARTLLSRSAASKVTGARRSERQLFRERWLPPRLLLLLRSALAEAEVTTLRLSKQLCGRAECHRGGPEWD